MFSKRISRLGVCGKPRYKIKYVFHYLAPSGSFGLSAAHWTNRDENKDRPASGPETIHLGSRTVLAPKDLEAGGTWLGTNDSGFFVGITNRFAATRHSDRRSRGEIPLIALEQETPEQAVAAVKEHAPTHFNAFHLLLADAHQTPVSSGATEMSSINLS